jgi:hypothetical protein
MQQTHAELLIHVGLHKTASTWLQDHLFHNDSAGFCAPWGTMSHAAVNHFVTVNPLHFDGERTRSYFLPEIERAASQGLVPVLTHEALSSQPLLGQYYAPQVGHWLKEVFPHARVLIVVREQKALITSLYRQYVRNGGTRSIEQFIGRGDEPVGWAPLCRLPFFEFDRLVVLYRELFGSENVLALPMELLRQNQPEFLTKILAFSGLSTEPIIKAKAANVGWSCATLSIFRRLNRVLGRNHLGPEQPYGRRFAVRLFFKLDRWIPSVLRDHAERHLEAVVTQRVGERYSESNRRLGNLLNLDLARFGYPTSRQPTTVEQDGQPAIR